jgi:predicted RNA-binding protein YlxR (DUF448 family)
MASHAPEGGAAKLAGAPGTPPGERPAAPSRKLRRGERQPLRSCIVTREAKPPAELIRFVLSPEGVVTPDIGRVLPGRGVWVTLGRALVAEAVRRKAFARAFRREVAIPADLPDLVSQLLRKDALQALSLANKAGALICGFEKVRAALVAGRVLALIEASDGSPEGRRKLIAAGSGRERGGEAEAGEPRLVDPFASADLDLALGRPHVIHAALLEAPAAGFALARCMRFRRFELIEKHASGGAQRRSASHESGRIEPQDRRLND